MKKRKVYDWVMKCLREYPATRDSDKSLIYQLLQEYGVLSRQTIFGHTFDVNMYYSFPALETITRARRKIQELHPELQSRDNLVKAARKAKEETKGTFIFREEVK